MQNFKTTWQLKLMLWVNEIFIYTNVYIAIPDLLQMQ